MKRHPAQKRLRFFPTQVFCRLYGRELSSMTQRELDTVQFFVRRGRQCGVAFVVQEGVLRKVAKPLEACMEMADAVLANVSTRILFRCAREGTPV